MTFTLILILNIVLDVAIIGTLAFVMSRPAKLTPHAEGVSSSAAAEKPPARERARQPRQHAASPLRPLLD